MTVTAETDACLVLVTCGNEREAETMARCIVTEKLAPCVNVLGTQSPVRSFYIWDDQLQIDSEVLLLIKTQFSRLDALEAKIRELHSYQVFEFIALPIQAGAQNYLSWLSQKSGSQ